MCRVSGQEACGCRNLCASEAAHNFIVRCTLQELRIRGGIQNPCVPSVVLILLPVEGQRQGLGGRQRARLQGSAALLPSQSKL